MNTLRNLLIGATGIVAATAVAGSALAASDTANVNASIIQPITITKVADVNFGTVARPTTASTSTVTINAGTGAETASGTGLVVTAGSRGSFTITGDGGRTYSSPSTATVNLVNGTTTSDDIVFTPAYAVNSGSVGTLPGATFDAATQTLFVGGTFDITNTTTPGAYTGTLTVTVNYQ